MPQAFGNGLIKKISAGGEGLIKKIYACYTPGEVALVYSASTQITYKVDTGTTYTEEIEYGSSALIPKSFTPTKTGYTFVGWRTDAAASSSVLTEKDVDTEEFTLYAVFKKTVKLSYDGNGSTGGSMTSQNGTQYYNNGNNVDPSFVLKSNGFSKTSYTFSKWSVGDTQYDVGATITVSTNTTVYAVWTMKSWVTIATYSNNITIGSNTGSNKKEDYTLTQSFSDYSRLKFDVGTWKEDGDDAGIMVIVKDSAGKTYGTFAVKSYNQEIEVETNGASTIIISHAGRYPDGNGSYTQALRLRAIYGIPN